MRIGVVGDTHNQMVNVDKIVGLFREARVERVVHTGDITQPTVLARFAALEVPLLGVYGNNDFAERERLAVHASRFGMDLTDPPRSFEWVGRRILVVHDPEQTPASLSDHPDLVLHGHTHRHRHERRGDTLIFNPGECAGFAVGHNAVGLIDLVSLEAQLLRF
ncbi:MAG: YfcE family phosphodiesterase [bacterium]|nr:YfcE family phosphodiesterase [Deltaproteobacteria bacterium]MCP4906582.1 YfcE family phosphodiesterase [bacterium]